jgi:hypothetical protein
MCGYFIGKVVEIGPVAGVPVLAAVDDAALAVCWVVAALVVVADVALAEVVEALAVGTLVSGGVAVGLLPPPQAESTTETRIVINRAIGQRRRAAHVRCRCTRIATSYSLPCCPTSEPAG